MIYLTWLKLARNNQNGRRLVLQAFLKLRVRTYQQTCVQLQTLLYAQTMLAIKFLIAA